MATEPNPFPSDPSLSSSGSTSAMGSSYGKPTSASTLGLDDGSSVGTMPGSSSGSTHGGSSAVGNTGGDLMSRVVQGAHQTIDRLAETAAPHVHKLTQNVNSAGSALHDRADQAREMGDEWAESVRSTVRENPLAAVGVALAVGLLIAKLTR